MHAPELDRTTACTLYVPTSEWGMILYLMDREPLESVEPVELQTCPDGLVTSTATSIPGVP